MYPEVFKHLSLYQNQLEIRQDQGDHWWELRSCAYYDSFLKPKIIYPDIALESRFSFDEENYYTNATAFIIPKNDKYLLALLNSSLIWFYLTKICPVIGDINKRGRLRLKTVYLNGLPIVNATPKDQKPFTPWKLVYTEIFSTRAEAAAREKKIKLKKSRKYIEWLIAINKTDN